MDDHWFEHIIFSKWNFDLAHQPNGQICLKLLREVLSVYEYYMVWEKVLFNSIFMRSFCFYVKNINAVAD